MTLKTAMQTMKDHDEAMDMWCKACKTGDFEQANVIGAMMKDLEPLRNEARAVVAVYVAERRGK